QFIAQVKREAPNQPSRVRYLAAPLIGRDAALAELNARLDSARQGQRELVFVTGEAGIGKTSLLDAFDQGLEGAGDLLIARGQCVEGFAGKEVFSPLLEAIGQLLRDARGPVLEVLSTHAPAWLMQFPFAVQPDRREALQREIIGVSRERMVREICEGLEELA